MTQAKEALPPMEALELVHVFALFRHGDRSPLSRLPGTRLAMDATQAQLWISRLAGLDDLASLARGSRVVNAQDEREPPASPRHGGRWPCGQLTSKGVRGMRAKGAAMRERYASFVAALNPPRDVYVESTNVRRTLRSAQSVLSGLFPSYFAEKSTRNEDDDDDDQSVILIRADAHSRIAPTHSYELYGDLATLLADDLRHRAPEGLAEASRAVRKVVGVNDGERVPWTALREVLTCRQEHGLSLPAGLTSELIEQIRGFDAWLWFALYGKRDFCFNSFHSGIERIYAHLNAVANGASPYKLSLFSGHDNSIVAFVLALELQVTPFIPDYGAMVTFEIYAHRATGALYVRPLLEGREIAFSTHAHAALCPFEHFQRAALKFMQHTVGTTAASAL